MLCNTFLFTCYRGFGIYFVSEFCMISYSTSYVSYINTIYDIRTESSPALVSVLSKMLFQQFCLDFLRNIKLDPRDVTPQSEVPAHQ